jgi:hypothetical protein
MQTGDVLQDEICKYLPDSSMPHRLRYQKKKFPSMFNPQAIGLVWDKRGKCISAGSLRLV